jgi:hypothetical protein
MHFFCIFLQKKTLGGTTPFFAKPRATPRHTPPRKTTFFRELVLIEGFQYKTQKNKIKKKFFFIFFICLKIFFFILDKKNIF